MKNRLWIALADLVPEQGCEVFLPGSGGAFVTIVVKAAYNDQFMGLVMGRSPHHRGNRPGVGDSASMPALERLIGSTTVSGARPL